MAMHQFSTTHHNFLISRRRRRLITSATDCATMTVCACVCTRAKTNYSRLHLNPLRARRINLLSVCMSAEAQLHTLHWVRAADPCDDMRAVCMPSSIIICAINSTWSRVAQNRESLQILLIWSTKKLSIKALCIYLIDYLTWYIIFDT